jgi:hypothetical protein
MVNQLLIVMPLSFSFRWLVGAPRPKAALAPPEQSFGFAE